MKNTLMSLEEGFKEQFLLKFNQYIKGNFKPTPENGLHISIFNDSFDCIAESNLKSFAAEDVKLNFNDKKSAQNIAIINIRGPLSYSSSMFMEIFGGSSYEQISRALKIIEADSSIGTLILKIQSPGGTVMGAPEVAEQIYKLNDKIKVISYADPYAFSAGYWLAAAAKEFYTMPSGMVGSVGVYMEHWDYSEYLKNEGLKVSMLHAGEKKVDANPYEPLSDGAKADIQAEIDEIYGMFVNALAKFRGVSAQHVIEKFGQGSTVMSKAALSAGMISGILTFDELLMRETQAKEARARAESGKALISNTKHFIEIEGLKK